MKKTIKNYCVSFTQSKLNELGLIAKRYKKVKNTIFQNYGSVNGIGYLRYPRDISNNSKSLGYTKEICGLQGRMIKQAISEAFSNMKTNLSLAKLQVKKSIRGNTEFTKEEKHYAYYILTSYELIDKSVTSQDIENIKKFYDLPIRKKKVEKYIKTKLRLYYRKPKQKKETSFLLDTNMYDLKFDEKGELWLAVMGLMRKETIKLGLVSKILPEKTIRIVLKNNKIEIHSTQEIEEISNNSGIPVGIDKGYSKMIVSSSGNYYGAELGTLQTSESDRLSEKNKKRNLKRRQQKYYESVGDFVKAENIKIHNLGTKKYDHRKEIEDNKLKTYINTELNRFFNEETPSFLAVENLNFNYKSKTGKRSKRSKMLMSSWLKGYLQERIEFKSKVNGVHLELVNPAYTSQTCHVCCAFGTRTGDKFYCETHGVVDADFNASVNILNRLNDEDIGVYTPYVKVKEILQRRLRLSNQDSLISESELTLNSGLE